MTPDSWVDPDYHWQPPADVAYTYDPAKANQLLDDAGYKDADGDGVREDKSGKPIKLRLWARAESPESQKTGSLLTGWFRDLGLKIEYQVMDDGIYYDSIWGYEGDTYSPDFDMYLWDWDGYADPGDTLASFTSAQIENWNEPCWSNDEYDAVVAEANTTLDPEKRKELVWRAQQIFYEQSPEIVIDYPDKLEAVNTAKWDGWTRMYDGTGAAFYTSYVRDSYLEPEAEDRRRRRLERRSGRRHDVVIAAVVVRRRRRGRRGRALRGRREEGGRGGVSRRQYTSTRSLPARFAAYSAASARATRSSMLRGHVRISGDADAHRDACRRPSSATGKSVSAMTRRRRSASASAPSAGRPSSVGTRHSPSPPRRPDACLGRTTANSSPP